MSLIVDAYKNMQLEESTRTRAGVGDLGQVGLGIERDGLVARVVTRHVALAAVDTHVLRISV